MKKHTIWTVLLLISMSFSMLNAFVIETNEQDHCTLQEYVQEFSQPTHCGDLCDIRYMFHISFILPDSTPVVRFNNHSTSPCFEKQFSSNEYIAFSFRPPIAA